VDRGGSGHVRRRAGLSAAWGQECLCHRGRVVSDVGVVESDVDHVWVGAGFGGEAELRADRTAAGQIPAAFSQTRLTPESGVSLVR
jgi:hypothetical protein